MTPDRITTHPGEVLAEDFLKPLGLSVNALALAMRVPANRIGAIVHGRRSVSADTALRLARFFGTSPDFWINLQAMHDLTKAKVERGAAIASEVKPRAAQGDITESAASHPRRRNSTASSTNGLQGSEI